MLKQEAYLSLLTHFTKMTSLVKRVSPDTGIEKKLELLGDRIKQAESFHLGDIDSGGLGRIMKTFNNKKMFCGDLGDHIRLPYPITWFDYICDPVEGVLAQHQSTKRGMLCQECDDGKSIFVNIFNFMSKNSCWEADPFGFMIRVSTEAITQEEQLSWVGFADRGIPVDTLSDKAVPGKFKELLGTVLSGFTEISQGNLHPVPVVMEISKELAGRKDDLMKESTADLGVLNIALMLLSCKNVKTSIKKCKPLGKLRKKKSVNSYKKMFAYKVLDVLVPATEAAPKRDGEPEPTGVKQRLHLCRGHFKTYSAGKPLFGKYVGRVWCPHHARGLASEGLIAKEYTVTAEKEKEG